MSADYGAPWLAAWRSWMDLAGKGFTSASGAKQFKPGASAGFAQAYLDFARVVQQILKYGGGGDFATRFVNAMHGAARTGAGQAANNDLLNAFLRAAPSALLVSFPHASAGQAWQQFSTTLQDWSAELLALPCVGPQREWLEMLKAVQHATLTEQVARARLDAHYRLVTRTALERFGRFLQDDNGPPITTVRALFDAWIDHAEAAYAERVMGDAFARDFGAWVDAGSDVRLALRALGGRVAAFFDTPGREEIDSLIKRQYDLQRELATLRAQRVCVPAEAATVVPPINTVEPAATQLSPQTIDTAARTKPTRKARSAAPPVTKAANTKLAKAPRVAAPKARKNKPARSEFDIAHILDAGK